MVEHFEIDLQTELHNHPALLHYCSSLSMLLSQPPPPFPTGYMCSQHLNAWSMPKMHSYLYAALLMLPATRDPSASLVQL